MALLRRRALRALLPAAALACAPAASPPPGRALAGPPPLPAGESRLGLAEGRDGIVIVPPGLGPRAPAPLLVFLHGARGDARELPPALRALAASRRFVLLVPESRGPTWDILLGDVGPDLAFLQRALDAVKARVPVDRTRVGLAGFSDGASYALTVGLRNRDVFSHVVAFSPGGSGPPKAPPPAVWIAHGTGDVVLPVAGAREIVAQLRRQGCAVVYREFEGGHEVPADVAADAVGWFLGG